MPTFEEIDAARGVTSVYNPAGAKTPVTATPAPAPAQAPSTTTRPYGTGLTSLGGNGTVGLNPDGVQEFATGPESFIGYTAPKPSTTPAPAPSGGGILTNPPAPAPAPYTPPTYTPPKTSTVNSTGSGAGYNGISTTTVQGKPANLASVDLNTETVEGRIQGLLSKENPVIKQAENRAMQQFAARGLLNTSMAIQAANEAMVSRAIDIAGPDAAAYRNQTLANQTAQNQFGLEENKQTYGLQTQGNDALIKSGLLGEEYAAKGTLQGQSDAAQMARLNVSEAGALERAKLDVKSNEDLNKLNSAKIYVEQMGNAEANYISAVNTIQADTKMTTAQKEQAIATQTALRDERVGMINRVSQALPDWSAEWAAVPVTQPEATTPATTTTPTPAPLPTAAPKPSSTYTPPPPVVVPEMDWASTYGG